MAIPDKIRAFLEQPHLCVMATINRDGSPQLTAMWYDIVDDIVILNTARGLLKVRNLARDPRMAVCIADDLDGSHYVTIRGHAEIVEDRSIQEAEVNRMAVRYRGARLAATHWQTIASQDRLGIHLHVEHILARGFD